MSNHEEEPLPIEILPEVKRKHSGESQGGPTTLFRIKLMTAEEIAEYGLEKYAPLRDGEAPERREYDE